MSDPILARIAITRAEWQAFRIAAIERDKRPSQVLADLVRRYLKGRK